MLFLAAGTLVPKLTQSNAVFNVLSSRGYDLTDTGAASLHGISETSDTAVQSIVFYQHTPVQLRIASSATAFCQLLCKPK